MTGMPGMAISPASILLQQVQMNAQMRQANATAQMQQNALQQQLCGMLANYEQSPLMGLLNAYQPGQIIPSDSYGNALPSPPKVSARERAEQCIGRGERLQARIAFWRGVGRLANPIVETLAERLEGVAGEIESLLPIANEKGHATKTHE